MDLLLDSMILITLPLCDTHYTKYISPKIKLLAKHPDYVHSLVWHNLFIMHHHTKIQVSLSFEHNLFTIYRELAMHCLTKNTSLVIICWFSLGVPLNASNMRQSIWIVLVQWSVWGNSWNWINTAHADSRVHQILFISNSKYCDRLALGFSYIWWTKLIFSLY